jgi:GNAT superfamily N-acetyltransferase
MIIRRATLLDAPGIAKVHVDSWKTTYKDIIPSDYLNQLTYEPRQKMWESAIPQSAIFVAENDKGEIVGFSTGGKERSGNYDCYSGELYAIYLLEEYQGQGLGKKLIKPIIDELNRLNIKTMLVIVLEDNPSRHFYESLGAKQIDTLEIEIGGKKLNELVYGWEDIQTIVRKVER